MDPFANILKNLWYLACPSSILKKGKLVRKILFGVPVILGREDSGKVFALDDKCPHRGTPFSAGRLVEENGTPCIECPYHGWRFRTENGVCAKIPALSDRDDFDGSSIKVRHYHLHESNGIVWIFNGEKPKIAAPELGLAADASPKDSTIMPVNAAYDEAVIGLVDPAHTPFVHRQWWWREGKAAIEKTKQFEPTSLGFRMPPHKPSSNSRIYKMLGGAPTTEIEFQLPGLRIETIRNQNHTIIGLTAMTPGDENEVIITHLIYWDMPLLTLLTPVVSMMSTSFLGQDRKILIAQNNNLARAPHRPLYAGDPDVPAQWYYTLKRAWHNSNAQHEFDNPLSGQSLRWKT